MINKGKFLLNYFTAWKYVWKVIFLPLSIRACDIFGISFFRIIRYINLVLNLGALGFGKFTDI